MATRTCARTPRAFRAWRSRDRWPPRAGSVDERVGRSWPGAGGDVFERLQGLPFEVAPEAPALAAGQGSMFEDSALEPMRWRTSSTSPKADMRPMSSGRGRFSDPRAGTFSTSRSCSVLHLDEVDDHLAAQVAQAQAAGRSPRRLQVGAHGRFLEVALARCAGVDVDGVRPRPGR